MKAIELIKIINKHIPEALPVHISEWSSESVGEGIWFKGSGEFAKDGRRVFDYYSVDTADTHPILTKILTDNGYYTIPYDTGTLMAYPE